MLINNPEVGSNGNGKYYKFSSGMLICTKRVISYPSVNSAWGSWYESTKISLGDWAHAFIDTDYEITASLQDGYAGLIEPISSRTKTTAGTTYLARPNVQTSAIFTINLIAVGRWK